MRTSLALLVALLPAPVACAQPDSWDKQRADCYELSLPMFQAQLASYEKFVASGKSWEKGVTQELAEVRRVATQTCKRWTENPNGSEALQEFVKDYSAIAGVAIDLRKRAQMLLSPRIEAWWKQEDGELAPYGIRFVDLACGQDFQLAQNVINARLAEMASRFDALGSQCPKAADGIIAKWRAEGRPSSMPTLRSSGPAETARGPKSTRASEITGTLKAETLTP